MRCSSPWFVQALWDGIEQSDCRSEFSTSHRLCIPLKKVKTYLQQKLNLSEEKILMELGRAKADGLVMSKAGRSNRSRGNGKESDVYEMPDQQEFTDRGGHDWYCFHCHEGKGNRCMFYCETCPRVYHRDCLNLDAQIENLRFTCPACELLVVRPSVDRLNISLDDMNNFIKYSCSRFYNWGIPMLNCADGRSWAKESGRNEAINAWRYDRLIYSSIDLSLILRKAMEFRYTSLEEYEMDCSLLVHNVAVYFGSNAVNRMSRAGNFQECVIHDIKEMQLCPDCFRHSNELQPNWFALPCSNPHEVVWARFKGFPFWPAKIIKKDLATGTYDVRFFGDEHERGLEISSRSIKPIHTSPSKLRIGRRTAGWKRAYEELKVFQQLASAAEKPLTSLDGHGSTLTDVRIDSYEEEQTEGRIPRALDQENTDATASTDTNNNNLILPHPHAPKRKKFARCATECTAIAEQLQNGEHSKDDCINLVTVNEDGTTTMTRCAIACTQTAEEVKNDELSEDLNIPETSNEGEAKASVNGATDDSPPFPTSKQQAGFLVQESNQADGAGQDPGSAVADVSLGIDAEDFTFDYKIFVPGDDNADATVTECIQEINSNNSEVVPTYKKPDQFTIPCTAADEEQPNDYLGEFVFTPESNSNEKDPLAVGSADETPPSAKEKTGLWESNQNQAFGQCSFMWSSDVKDIRVAQLLEDLQCCESVDGTDLAIISMILEKRKGCECAGCQDKKLRVCNCKLSTP